MNNNNNNKNITEKLQWEVKHQGDFKNEVDFLNTLLEADGVDMKNIDKFLNPTIDCLHDPFLLKNMDKAVEIVHDKLQKDKCNIYIKCDSDSDGVCSMATLAQFLQKISPNVNIEWGVSRNKSHGLFFSDLSNYTKDYFDLIMVPDASSPCKEIIQIRDNFSAEVIGLDHHRIENEYQNIKTGQWISSNEALDNDGNLLSDIQEDCYTNYYLVVNCMDGQYPNPHISGAGVVQKFIEAYVDKYGETDNLSVRLKSYFYDLVSLGNIADSMDVRDLETRYYALKGLDENCYNNEFIKELVDRNPDEFKYGRTLTNSGWVLGPRINAVFRYGKDSEQDDMVKAMMGVHEDREYQPRRRSKNDPKPPVEIHSLQWDMARVCDNIKSRQDTEVRKFVVDIDKQIQEKDLLKNSILVVDGTKILTKGTTSGLVANKIASKYFRPVLLLRSKDPEHFGGSGRGYDKGPVKNFNEFLTETGLITCLGHSSAFGLDILKENVDALVQACNDKLPVDQLCTIHQVDWEIPADQMKKKYVKQVAENHKVFGGNGVPEPLFAISNLHINASEINSYGQNAGFIRFVYNGITFVKKYCPIGDYDKMTFRDRKTFGINKKPLVLNLICQFVLNSWEDKINPEVKILFYDSRVDDGGEEFKEEKKTTKITTGIKESGKENKTVKENKTKTTVNINKNNSDFDDWLQEYDSSPSVQKLKAKTKSLNSNVGKIKVSDLTDEDFVF